MKKLKFYKEYDGRWYIDLPNWLGNKEDLEMVCGADTMLDYIADSMDYVNLGVSEAYFDGSDELKYIGLADDLGNGAYYRLDTYKGISIELDMWLCDVTKFVFGYFPSSIYIIPLYS